MRDGETLLGIIVIIAFIVFTGNNRPPLVDTPAPVEVTSQPSTPVEANSADAAPPITPASPTVAADAPVVADARTQLAGLEVKGKAPKKDRPGGRFAYDRDLFGQAWSDDVTVPGGHNGCDTRNDILRAQLTDVVLKPGTNGCVVLSGTVNDPYSGDVIPFQRGKDTSSLIQIDHVVALANAWQTGAFNWDADTRRNFANDPLNLLAVRGDLNMQKKDGDAATWLPPEGRCAYAMRQIAVKHTYGLWVTPAEKTALETQLDTCNTPS